MDVSRRNFVKSGAALAAGLAAGASVAMLGCSSENASSGQKSAADGSAIEWTGEADLIYVGAGCAGAMGSAAANNRGASVILLEKMDEANAGGNTICYGGIFGQATGGGLISRSFGKVSEQRVDNIAEAGEELQEWVEDYSNLEFIEGTTVVKGAGRAVYAAMKKYLEDETDVEVVYGTPVTSLVENDEGEIIGVKATQDGSDVYYKARKGVVLTSGGYNYNTEMIQAFNYPALQTTAAGHPSTTGDGIRIAMAKGAALGNMGTAIDWFEFAFAKPSRELGTGIANRQWSTFGGFGGGRNIEPHPSKIFVNMQGKRFMNEARLVTHDKTIGQEFLDLDAVFMGDKKATNDYVNLPMFLVCDSECFNSAPLGAVPDDDEWTYARVGDVYQWSDDNQAEVEKGWFCKADTIEELAAQMSAASYCTGEEKTIDPTALKSTIEAYNAACAAGTDDECGRPGDTLAPIVTPPFYAAEMMPCIVYTISGLVSGDNSEVLRWDGTPISRLYCAGDVGQGVDLVASGAPTCMAAAIVAAEHATALEPWDASTSS